MPKRDDVFSNRGNLPSLFAKIAELFLRFHLKHHRMGRFEVAREVDAVATVAFLAQRGSLLASHHLDFARPQVLWHFKPIGLRHRAFLFIQEENSINLVTLLRETELAVSEGIDRPCAINSLAVYLHPFADFLHAEQGGVRQVAIGIGAYVEEEVAALGYDVAEQMDEFVGAFIGVGRDIRP